MDFVRAQLLAAYTPPLPRCRRKCCPEVQAADAVPCLLHMGFLQKRQQHMDFPEQQVTLPGLQLQLRRMGSQLGPGLPPAAGAVQLKVQNVV